MISPTHCLFFFIVAFVSASKPVEYVPPGYTDEQIMDLVKFTCPPLQLMCPKAEYSPDPPMFIWNVSKILNSLEIRLFNKGMVREENYQTYFKSVFCCSEGPCLADCRIKRREESVLVKNFPKNVDAIFGLKLKGLEPFKSHVYSYVEGKQKSSTFELTAEIEEYFDYITEHEKEIMALLEKKKSLSSK